MNKPSVAMVTPFRTAGKQYRLDKFLGGLIIGIRRQVSVFICLVRFFWARSVRRSFGAPRRAQPFLLR